MAEAAHPMHLEVESEPEYDGYSITQFIYDLLLVRLDPCLLYILRVSFCILVLIEYTVRRYRRICGDLGVRWDI
jgi:hypothetical protein